METDNSNKNKDLEGVVHIPNEELIICDYKECPERGQEIKCYFDIHKNCDLYKERKDL